MKDGALYYGDCLDWMREWLPDARESVDLIYLDPPFNSNTNYNILFGSDDGGQSAQMRGFADTWNWDRAAAERMRDIENAPMNSLHSVMGAFRMVLGNSGMLAYLSYMGLRLLEMRSLLKPTGSIYLHCDPTASHYLKMLMDAIFGPSQFQNEVIWRYRRWPAKQRRFQKMHDVILMYWNGKSVGAFNQLYEELAPSTVETWGTKAQVADFSSGRRKPSQTEDESPGAPMSDVWNIGIIAPIAKERLGYPTQKPLKLLKRIIEASSNPGDLVLDPFCGCGTTIEAAHQLDRRWVGIDISATAIDLILERRLKPLGIEAEAFGIPQSLADARKLATEKPFDFEAWAVTRVPGLAPNERKRGDEGIDGRGRMLDQPTDHEAKLVLAQVKGGRNFQLGQFRDFLHVVEREGAACGVFITPSPVASGQARALAAEAGEVTVGAERYPRVQLWSIADYFEGRRPHLPVLTDPYTGKPVEPRIL